MATLHKTIDVTRKILAIGAMVIGGVILLMILINGGKAIKELLFPTPPPPPTVAFGKLPTVTFPTSQITRHFTYSLNTLSGSLPAFPDRATVYQIAPLQPNLLALQKMQSMVSQVGFIGNPQPINDTTYAWVNKDDLPKTFTANTLTNEFTITSQYLTNTTVAQSVNLPDQDGAIAMATNFLTNMGNLPTDLDNGKTKASLFSTTGGILAPATSLSSSQIIRVDLFQKDIEKMPIFYPQPTKSTMYFLIGGGATLPQIVAAKYFHQEITDQHATYPITSAATALQELKDGKAYIAGYDGTDTNIAIRNVTLGYYLGDSPQKYLMPIVVFQGDNGFFAYVSAVTGEWVQN